MNIIKIWHNPRCSKSKEALNILEENGCEKDVVKYLEVDLNKEQIRETLRVLNLNPRELMRTGEDIYNELNLQDESSDEKLIEAMREHPILIQRPIIFKDDRAIIGRPTSKIITFLES